MKFKKDDIVVIDNPLSNYHCLIAKVIDFDEKTNIYTVDTLINKVGVYEKFLRRNKND